MRWIVLPQNSQVLAVHAALVHTNEILFFSGDEHDRGQNERGELDHSRVFGCTSLEVRRIGSPASDVFCSGQAFAGDGRLVVTGGTEAFPDEVGGIHGEAHHSPGLRQTWLYDAGCHRWTEAALLSPEPGRSVGGGRWYPTLVTLANGLVMAISGHPSSSDPRATHNADRPETFSPYPPPWGRWRLLPGTADRPLDLYPRALLLPDGRVFVLETAAGERVWALDPTTGTWSDVAPAPVPNYNGLSVTCVLLPLRPRDGYRARVLACGHGQPLVLDLGSPSPAWQATGPRTLPGQPRRVDLNAVLLPTGEVFVCGGTNPPGAGKPDSSAVLEAELYRPDSGTWQTLPRATVPRNYHSVALLMPDGRVWTAGSNKDARQSFDPPGSDNRELRIELFEPDYHANPNRPVIARAPGRFRCRQVFQVETPQAGAIREVAILRCGSVTHAFNADQRHVELAFRQTGRDRLEVTAPPDNNIAPPGYYLLFLIDRAGVPSVGRFVLMGTGEWLGAHAILFEHRDFRGAHKHVFGAEPNLAAADDSFFNDRVSSIAILRGNWAFFRHVDFGDRYPVVLGPGLHPFVGDIGIANDDLSSLRPVADPPTVQGAPIEGHAILFEHRDLRGAHKHVFRAEPNLAASDDAFFNDRTSSLAVLEGYWSFYRHVSFAAPYQPTGGRDLVLGPGLYPWVEDVGITNDDLSSLRPVARPQEEIVGEPLGGHCVLFEHRDFHGAHKHVLRAEPNLAAPDDAFFNDRVSSVAVLRASWAFYRHIEFVDQYPCLLGPWDALYRWVEPWGIRNDDLSSLQPWPETR